jgi:hypothetical protein
MIDGFELVRGLLVRTMEIEGVMSDEVIAVDCLYLLILL